MFTVDQRVQVRSINDWTSGAAKYVNQSGVVTRIVERKDISWSIVVQFDDGVTWSFFSDELISYDDYVSYRTALTAALAAPGAWDFLDNRSIKDLKNG